MYPLHALRPEKNVGYQIFGPISKLGSGIKAFLSPSKSTEDERWSIVLDVWLFYSLKDDSGKELPNNEWCLKASKDKIDTDDTIFPWKGDLYLFANMDEGQFDHIAEDICTEDLRAILQSFDSQFVQRWSRHCHEYGPHANRVGNVVPGRAHIYSER